MNLNYGNDFTILRVVGAFIGIALCYKVYSILSAYQPGMMSPVSAGDVIVFALSFLIVIYCLTMYWRVELDSDHVVSDYGFILWRKKKIYQSVKSIDFTVDFIEVKNGPSKAYISVNLSIDGRTRAYPVCRLDQVRKSLFMKVYFQKKFDEELLTFKADVNTLRNIYPKIPITLDQKVVPFYESLTSEVFPWC